MTTPDLSGVERFTRLERLLRRPVRLDSQGLIEEADAQAIEAMYPGLIVDRVHFTTSPRFVYGRDAVLDLVALRNASQEAEGRVAQFSPQEQEAVQLLSDAAASPAARHALALVKATRAFDTALIEFHTQREALRDVQRLLDTVAPLYEQALAALKAARAEYERLGWPRDPSAGVKP